MTKTKTRTRKPFHTRSRGRVWRRARAAGTIVGGAAIVFVLALFAAWHSRSDFNRAPLRYTYRVVKTYPHDREAFTQGLVFDGGRLFESTGLEGKSSVREVELETGKVLRIHRLEDRLFGEGLALWRDCLIQLTWRSGTGFVYDRDTLEPRAEFSYSGEGWGLTHDGKRLIRSDGTAVLRFLDPETFAPVGFVEVRDDAGPVEHLNELEWVKGEVWANVWRSDSIVRIDPESGRVVGWIDLSGLLDRGSPDAAGADVFNGIAYDPAGDRVFVTGKRWPRLFEVEIVPKR